MENDREKEAEDRTDVSPTQGLYDSAGTVNFGWVS